MRAMGIGGLLNTRNAAAADAEMRRQMHQTMHIDSHSPYGLDHQSAMAHVHHQHQMGQPSHMAYPTMGVPQHAHMLPATYMSSHSNSSSHPMLESDQMKPKNEPAPKAFACSTCAKKFARRSDLARHERIHSGVRPHACDFPGCGKQFIQRSALTVHARVHTGEKPHMCERCGKPFSDSSSLARHRRIHSGKRPYQCPFANCQKTFTRRTTLTRHQNNHAGTVEQAEAETNAKLAMTQPPAQTRSNNSTYSEAASSHSTISPTRPVSTSPHHEMPVIPSMQKSNSDYSYMPQSQIMPPHIRGDFHPGATRAPQSIHTGPISSFASASQPSLQMGLHHSGFRPPQHVEQQSSTNEGPHSPHMSGMGWTTDNNTGMTNSTGMEAYQYQDPAHYAGHTLYYPGSNIRRPQSTEPEEYGMRQRFMGHHLGGSGMPTIGTEWNQLPINLHDVKQERAFAN